MNGPIMFWGWCCFLDLTFLNSIADCPSGLILEIYTNDSF